MRERISGGMRQKFGKKGANNADNQIPATLPTHPPPPSRVEGELKPACAASALPGDACPAWGGRRWSRRAFFTRLGSGGFAGFMPAGRFACKNYTTVRA